METVVVRLKTPILVGHQQVPNNAVVAIEAEEARKLLDYDPPLAEKTDAVERYPIAQPILAIDDFAFWGHEKFPRDTNLIPPPPPNAFRNDIDRHVEDNIRAGMGPAAPAGGKEPVAARIDESTIDQGKVKEEEKATAAARVAEAVPVVVVKEETATKEKGKH